MFKPELLGCTHHRAVSNLNGLEHVKRKLGTLAGEDKTITGSVGVVNLISNIDCL